MAELDMYAIRTTDSCACCRLCLLDRDEPVIHGEHADHGASAPITDDGDDRLADEAHRDHTMGGADDHAGHGPDHNGQE